MNVSLYQAAAAMNAQLRWQEMITENLASASVPGFRKNEISFEAVQAGLLPSMPGTAQMKSYMPVARPVTSFEQGSLRPTNNLTDVAIEGKGFFEVQMPDGSAAYTRDGEFHINAQGQLVTKQGYFVASDAGPIQLDLNNPAPIHIAANGEVSQGADVKGKLRVAEFNSARGLSPIGQGYLRADNQLSVPRDAVASSLRQGFLEAANTTSTLEMSSLITAMRMFEANQRVMQMQDERMGKSIAELAGT